MGKREIVEGPETEWIAHKRLIIAALKIVPYTWTHLGKAADIIDDMFPDLKHENLVREFSIIMRFHLKEKI